MMTNITKQTLSLLLLVFLITGCTTKVIRVGTDEKIDISGKWNDYDAMLVAKEMVSDSLKRSWLSDFKDTMGRDPVVIVGHVANQSSEHVNTDVVVKYLERELLNSGEVVFVANPLERTQVREEREDQQKGFTDPATMAEIGKERGADFMMIGSFNSVIDEVKNKSVMFYQVNLELVNLKTNQKVWIGQKEVKKLIKRPRYSL